MSARSFQTRQLYVHVTAWRLDVTEEIQIALLDRILYTADVTTKDLLTSNTFSEDPPCCGRRSPTNLMRSWVTVCCGPVRHKRWLERHPKRGLNSVTLSQSAACNL